jgi:hypothetical protein
VKLTPQESWPACEEDVDPRRLQKFFDDRQEKKAPGTHLLDDRPDDAEDAAEDGEANGEEMPASRAQKDPRRTLRG